MKRRMAAIMVGDVVGYSSMMEFSEERTAERLHVCHEMVSHNVALLDGRIFSTAGDAMLAEFPSPINAVRCAVEVRNQLAGADDSADEPMRMRFGLHLADVVVRGDDLIGDGVNLATRIEQAADPGAILVSGVLFDQVRRNSPFIFEDLGDRKLKNISEPIHIYRVRGEMGAHRLQAAPTRTETVRVKQPWSIAVLPFHTVESDEEQRVLAEGLTEELIVELGRFRRLSVSSRSASFALLSSRMDPIALGDVLAVRFVIEGQVRKIGDQVRIGLTLTETDAGSVVWSDKITCAFASIFDVLDATIRKIAATVVGRVEDASMVAARRKPPENMTAFECLLRGVDHHRLGGVTDDNARKAVSWFSKAIEADPSYGAAYAWRVCAASWLSDFDLDQGERDIRRALELDPCDAEANRIMGVLELLKGNFEAAKAHNLKAMELNPTDAYIKARCASVMTYVGEADRSLKLLDQAEALDPFLPVWCIEERGVALYAMGRYEEAIKVLGELVFQTYRSRLYRAASLVALDQSDEARRLIKEALAGNPGISVSGVLQKERYRDVAKRQELGQRLAQAGLPS
jgi:adenylate cyclase